jgi:hypothetical protein
MSSLDGLIGKTVGEAKQWLAEAKPMNNDTVVTMVRAVNVDGEEMMCTKDYRVERANVVVVAEKITEVRNCN